jgi:hypothetical protein
VHFVLFFFFPSVVEAFSALFGRFSGCTLALPCYLKNNFRHLVRGSNAPDGFFLSLFLGGLSRVEVCTISCAGIRTSPRQYLCLERSGYGLQEAWGPFCSGNILLMKLPDPVAESVPKVGIVNK